MNSIYPRDCAAAIRQKKFSQNEERHILEESGTDVVNERDSQGRLCPPSLLPQFYEGKNPVQVQEVTSQLASLYLEEDLKARERLDFQYHRFF
ncbi:MAG: hypothetical protein U5J82_03385 [Desulfobacterales bacterium]|nr:hypothetical protein [Desulfobacterales bacterium]